MWKKFKVIGIPWNVGMKEYWINEESPGKTSDPIKNIKPHIVRLQSRVDATRTKSTFQFSIIPRPVGRY